MLQLWLQYLQAGALVLIPPIGAWIAWQQAQIAKARLDFDLYQKRYAVFEAARRLLAEVKKNPEAQYFDLDAYDLETADAVFLHTDDLSEVDLSTYLSKLKVHAACLLDLNKKLHPFFDTGDDKTRLEEEHKNELKWFDTQTPELVEHFKKWLKLDKSKRWQAWRIFGRSRS